MCSKHVCVCSLISYKVERERERETERDENLTLIVYANAMQTNCVSTKLVLAINYISEAG